MDGLDSLDHHNSTYQNHYNQDDHNHPHHAQQQQQQQQQQEYKSPTNCSESLNNKNNHNSRDQERLVDEAAAPSSGADAALVRSQPYETGTLNQENKLQYLHENHSDKHQINSSTTYAAHQTTNNLANNNASQDAKESGANSLDEDDAFIAYCADSSSVLNNDPNRRYHINKLYQPLSTQNHQQQQQQQQNTDKDMQLIEPDDEYLLYQELRFIEASARELCNGSERSELTKILDEDDRDAEDSLDLLQMTNIMESFDSFAASPLMDSCGDGGDQNPMQDVYSHESTTSPDKPDSSGRGNERSPISDYSANECYERLSPRTIRDQTADGPCNLDDRQATPNETGRTNDCYSTNHINQEMYSDPQRQQQQQSHAHHIIVVDSNSQLCGPQSYRARPTQAGIYHEDLSENSVVEISSSRRISNTNHQFNEYHHQSPATVQLEDKETVVSTVNDAKRAQNQPHLAEQEAATTSGRKSKKRATSTLVDDLKLANNKSKITKKQRSNEHQFEQTTTSDANLSLFDDEDDAGFSDNNSMKSDTSRRNPIINHYRRRTANARERIRMREINQAFEKLKKVVPIELVQQASEAERLSEQLNGDNRRGSSSTSSSNSNQSSSDAPKLTKITTLRLAVSYIAKLSSLLSENPENSIASCLEEVKNGDDTRKANGSAKAAPAKATKRRGRNLLKKPSSESGKKAKTAKISTKKSSSANDASAAHDHDCRSNVFEPKKSVECESAIQIRPQQQQQQQPILIANSLFNRGINQQQTAYITIPNNQHQQNQKQQYITTYPNQQQQLLISQPFSSNQDRALVTPFAVAILGIPTTYLNTVAQPSQLYTNAGQTSQAQPLNIHPQQQQQRQQSSCNSSQTMFRASNNVMTIATSPANQIFQNQTIPFGQRMSDGTIQVGQHKTANLVYINQTMGPGARQQQQICFVNQQGSQQLQVSGSNQGPLIIKQQRNNETDTTEQRDNLTPTMTPQSFCQTKFVAQFSAQSNNQSQVQTFQQQQQKVNLSDSRESNINKLVENLATSIQPVTTIITPADQTAMATLEGQTTSPCGENQQQQPRQQSTQPVRTYRFHNYDGNMITNHLYNQSNNSNNAGNTTERHRHQHHPMQIQI